MKKAAKFLSALAFAACVLMASQSTQAQGKANRPSPPAQADCKLADGSTVHMDYSSPRMKGRKVYGDLVPFGSVWRTGANEATTFVVSGDVKVGGKVVPKGNYTIFTLPNANEWSLIVNKTTGEWGIPYPGEASDLARAPMKVSKLPSPVENFTISFAQTGGGCTMNIDWETTRASIEIKR